MVRTHTLMFTTISLFIGHSSYLCYGMEDLRRQVLETNAHMILYDKMKDIIDNKLPIQSLNEGEQYVLLLRLDEQMKNKKYSFLEEQAAQEGTELSRKDTIQLKKFRKWRAFFERLKTFVSPELLRRALYPDEPSPEITPPPSPPPVPPRHDTPPPSYADACGAPAAAAPSNKH